MGSLLNLKIPLYGVIYRREDAALLKVPQNVSGVFEIPEGVTKIGDYAFGYCPRLTDITLPASLTEIGEKAFEDHGGNRHPCPGGQLCGAVRQGEQHQVSAAVKKRGACV